MQDIEDNMDDLFRKAATEYTPNPGDSQWGTIHLQLLKNSIVSVAPVIENKKKKKKVLLLLLLLPLMVGVISYYSNNTNEKKAFVTAGNTAKQNLPQKKINTFTSSKTIVKAGTKNKNQYTNTSSSTTFYTANDNILSNPTGGDDLNNEYKISGFTSIINEDLKSSSVNGKLVESATALPKINADQDKVNFTSPEKNLTVVSKQKRLYAGIVLGSAFNEVKNQGFKKAGLSAGIIAGYKLIKNISLETGLQYKKKYYFSDGKYFDMTKTIASMPAGMKVLRLKGSSNVLEIPVGIKYNVKHTSAFSWFASAGISSYILLKENNNYTGSLNGVQENLKGLYKTVSTGLASSVDLSIGYEHAIGKQSNLRIQPYLQIPLKGMGIGNIQVMSTGINLTITRLLR